MEFSRQEYWSGQPCPPPGDLANQEKEPGSPAMQADSLPSEPPGKPATTLGQGNMSHILLIYRMYIIIIDLPALQHC